MIEHHNCGDLLADLSDYISGEAAQELCKEIEAHLAGCENCRVMVDSLRKTIHLFQETSDLHLPRQVRERLLQSLDLAEYT
ncbi:MAG: zf-HC2 domain-containing protein [Chloroflexota bacterium]